MLCSRRLLAAALLPVFGACSDGPSAPRPVHAVVVSPATLTLASGTSVGLSATVLDDKGRNLDGRTIVWSSANSALASVSDVGQVTARQSTEGTPSEVVITATVEGVAGTATITVTPVFLRAENGVTIICPNAAVGDSGSVGGVVYSKRTRAGLDFLLRAGDAAALSTSCTSGVTDMSNMFRGYATFNEDISTWDVGEVTSMASMFDNASAFNASIAAWDVSKVTDMAFMFYRAPAFNKPIGAWKVGQVTRMLQMFDGATAFDQDVSGWDVRAVTNMNFMFFEAAAFNRDLSSWCVSQFPSKPTYFDVNASAWVLPKPVWGSCPTGR